MLLNKCRLYTILSIACIAGYIWIYSSIVNVHSESNFYDYCLIKQVTSLPCPSCGSTRAVILLIQGDIEKAFYTNPLGLFIAFTLIITPLWILSDLLSGTKSLFNFYIKTEHFLKNPKITIPLILMVLGNWIWNITKGL